MFIAHHVRPAGLLPVPPQPVYRIARRRERRFTVRSIPARGGVKQRLPFVERAAAMRERQLRARRVSK